VKELSKRRRSEKIYWPQGFEGGEKKDKEGGLRRVVVLREKKSTEGTEEWCNLTKRVGGPNLWG